MFFFFFLQFLLQTLLERDLESCEEEEGYGGWEAKFTGVLLNRILAIYIYIYIDVMEGKLGLKIVQKEG